MFVFGLWELKGCCNWRTTLPCKKTTCCPVEVMVSGDHRAMRLINQLEHCSQMYIDLIRSEIILLR